MASIARLPLEIPADWGDIAERATAWANECGVDMRGVIVLVPFAQHLVPARLAWVRRAGWQPRIETTRTLAASLRPAPRVGEGQITFDASTDRLQAARMLRSQSWVRRDPQSFDEAVAAVVDTAHALARAAAAMAPQARVAHFERGRDLLAVAGGPGGTERALARVALEWAALAPAPPTDALFDHRPTAWVVVQAGGEDALAAQLLSAAPDGVPCLVLDADAMLPAALPRRVSMAACEGFEDEAECAAAQVLCHLQHGEAPVALVAQDRLLVRRVRALLERQGVALHDETGWKLSTTRAAAQVMSLLRAAAGQASADQLLDWLKAGAWPGQAPATAELEAAYRRAGWTRMSSIHIEKLPPDAAVLHTEAAALLALFAAERRQTLAKWLALLQLALERCSLWSALEADLAGAQVLQVLHLDDAAGWAAQPVAQAAMTLDDFTAWVDGALEGASFVPDAAGEAAPVVITPLARVMLRPFVAVVFPGADDRHLGASPPPQPLLGDAQAAALGVPTAAQRREAEGLAYAHALSGAPVSLFYRRHDGDEPLALSPLVERTLLRLRRAGRTCAAWADPRGRQAVPLAPMRIPTPQAPQLLPDRLSASACEALRACPYRFYALHLLRLREADELGDEIEQRDYGTWLHAVLMKFHERRAQPLPAEVECAQLLAIADEEKALHGLDDADFLPFEDGFAELAPRYIAWVHQRDSEGARWWQGEQDRERQPPEWQGIRLHGRIDRMDHVRAAGGPAIELIDYKTGSATALRDKLRQPLEDTQLAFYVALMQPEVAVPLAASYLTLGRQIESLAHPAVEDSAQALVEGVGNDLARIRQGAAMPALGEPPVCDYCEARGLCRRDHWTPA